MAGKPPAAPRVLDVCRLVQEGESPCAAVNGAIRSLRPGQDLVLRVPFEPRPLYAVMAGQGFGYESIRISDGSWRVRFFPLRGSARGGVKCAPGCGHAEDCRETVRLDVRRLDAPGQVAAALRAVGKLGEGRRLALHSARKPARLLRLLAAKGCAYDCSEQRDRSYVTKIWREAGGARARPPAKGGCHAR